MSIRITCIWAVVLTTTSPARAVEPFRVRILCYNIHHGAGVDGKLDLERIGKVIRSVSPDVVALQEVDRNTRRTGRVDQPAELARLTGMKVEFGPNIDFQGGKYGNAVLSKWPIEKRKNVWLPKHDDGEQRGALVCELKPPSFAEPMTFICTHLDHRQDDRERVASAKRINEFIAKRGDPSTILAGDLNATRDSRPLQILTKEWRLTNDMKLPTVPVGKPKRQIDFILFLRKSRWKAVETRVLDEAIASDHRAVFAILEFQSAPRPANP